MPSLFFFSLSSPSPQAVLTEASLASAGGGSGPAGVQCTVEGDALSN